MTLFRFLLVAVIVAVTAYTIPVLANHGFTLYGVFFGDMSEMAWPGQFNFDFLMFLFFSAGWMAWRNEFSPTGWLLAVGAVLLGAPYLALYLLIMSYRVNGDVTALLLGASRAEKLRSGQ